MPLLLTPTMIHEDIFVSYAHVDDATLLRTRAKVRVTEVIRCLKVELARKLGRSDALHVVGGP